MGKFGIGGWLLKLFSCYLSDRYQCDEVSDVYSKNVSFASGVPQTSISGPLFFVVFVNDLPDDCNSSFFFLYADYSKMICNSILSSQSDLNAYIEWSNVDLMQFNATKTQFWLLEKIYTHLYFLAKKGLINLNLLKI